MSGPFKLKGWSPFTQKFKLKPEKEGEGKYHYKKAQHPKKESPPEHKDLEVTRSKVIGVSEDIDDINDRIQFLQDDISEGNISAAEGNKKIKSLKAALAKLQPK
jgi:archaellum component FlaC